MDSNISRLFDLPFFKIKDDIITLKTTDAVHAARPPSPTMKASVLLTGPYQDQTASEVQDDWLQELGTDIARNFLAVGVVPGKTGMVRKVEGIGATRGQIYYLAAIPRNYIFYVKIRQNPHKKSKGHKDAYLHGNDRTWRSANEFKPHLAWLMSGRPIGYSCECIQCSTAELQQPINTERRIKLHKLRVWLINAAKQGFERPINALNLYAYLQKQYTAAPGLNLVSQLGEEFIREEGVHPAQAQAQPSAVQAESFSEPPSSDTITEDEEMEDSEEVARQLKKEKEMMQLTKEIKYNNEEFFRGLDSDMN